MVLPAVYLCLRVQEYTTYRSFAAKPFTLLIVDMIKTQNLMFLTHT